MCSDPIPELKRQMGEELAKRIAKWNQREAAYWIVTEQPRVSELRRGKLERFSLETLLRFLSRLRCRITIAIEDIPYPQLQKKRQLRALRTPAAGADGNPAM